MTYEELINLINYLEENNIKLNSEAKRAIVTAKRIFNTTYIMFTRKDIIENQQLLSMVLDEADEHRQYQMMLAVMSAEIAQDPKKLKLIKDASNWQKQRELRYAGEEENVPFDKLVMMSMLPKWENQEQYRRIIKLENLNDDQIISFAGITNELAQKKIADLLLEGSLVTTEEMKQICKEEDANKQVFCDIVNTALQYYIEKKDLPIKQSIQSLIRTRKDLLNQEVKFNKK